MSLYFLSSLLYSFQSPLHSNPQYLLKEMFTSHLNNVFISLSLANDVWNKTQKNVLKKQTKVNNRSILTLKATSIVFSLPEQHLLYLSSLLSPNRSSPCTCWRCKTKHDKHEEPVGHGVHSSLSPLVFHLHVINPKKKTCQVYFHSFQPLTNTQR